MPGKWARQQHTALCQPTSHNRRIFLEFGCPRCRNPAERMRHRDELQRSILVQARIEVHAYRDQLLKHVHRWLHENTSFFFLPATQRRVRHTLAYRNAQVLVHRHQPVLLCSVRAIFRNRCTGRPRNHPVSRQPLQGGCASGTQGPRTSPAPAGCVCRATWWQAATGPRTRPRIRLRSGHAVSGQNHRAGSGCRTCCLNGRAMNLLILRHAAETIAVRPPEPAAPILSQASNSAKKRHPKGCRFR